MKLISSFINFLILLLLVSCVGNSKLESFQSGQCFKESRTDYASYAKQKVRVYRIEDIVEKRFIVSLWYENGWFYQGKKKVNYFDNRSSLTYEETNCPGTKKNVAITDKIKGIDIN